MLFVAACILEDAKARIREVEAPPTCNRILTNATRQWMRILRSTPYQFAVKDTLRQSDGAD